MKPESHHFDSDQPDLKSIRIFTAASHFSSAQAVRCGAAEFLSAEDFPPDMFEDVIVDSEPAVVTLWPSTFQPRYKLVRKDRLVTPDGVQWVVVSINKMMGGFRIDCGCLRHAALAPVE